MILRYAHLSKHPQVFLSMTGLRITEFDQLAADLAEPLNQAHQARLLSARPVRQRAVGAGLPQTLSLRDQLLLSVVWLRLYPTHEVLGYLFAVSDSTVSRYISQVLPLLEAAGRATMRMPDPGRKRRRSLDELLTNTPQLVVVIDSFEQSVQRPRKRTEADTYYSGKKKQHTLKVQLAVDEETGEIVDVSESVLGPTADIKLLEQSKLLDRLPTGVGGIGDLAYVGIDKLHPQGLGAAPRKKKRDTPRSPEDIAYNTAFSRRRIIVENSIGRIRNYKSITAPDRNHRQKHNQRVVAVVGLANRQIRNRLYRAA